MRQGSFEVQMFIGGQRVREFNHQGRTRLLAVGEQDFILRFTNQTNGRVEVQASVDGLSIMDGKLAGTINDTGGYIINRFGTIEIPGYRLNDKEVAKFHLGGVEQSYARRMDAPTDIGVIGVRFYAERIVPPMQGVKGGDPGLESMTLGAPGLGTSFGDRTEHRVTTVSFDRGDLLEQFVFDYNNVAGYAMAGIPVPPETTGGKDAFPGDRRVGATPPPGWR